MGVVSGRDLAWLWTMTSVWAKTSWVLQNLRAIIADLAGESENISLHAAKGYKWRIELMYRDLLVKECLDGGLAVAPNLSSPKARL